MSNRYDFTGTWNEPFSAIIGITSPDGFAFDLSQYNFTGAVRYRYGDQDLAGFDITPQTPLSSGILQIKLSKQQMSGLPISQCVHYVKAVPASGEDFVLELTEGYFDIYPV